MRNYRSYTTYPNDFPEAIQRVFDSGQPLIFECESRAQVMNLRGQMYAYMAALNRAAGRDKFARELADNAGKLVIVEPPANGTTFTLCLKSDRPAMRALRSALDAASPPSELAPVSYTTTELEESVRRLLLRTK